MAPARRNNKPPAAGQDEAHKATNHLESIVMAEQVGCLAFSSSETSRLAKEDQEEEEEEHEARNETKEKPKTNESQSQQVDTAKKLISLASNQHSDVEEEPAMAGRAAQAGPEQVAESDGTSNADEKQEQQPQQECPEQPVDDTASNLANLLLAEALRRTDEAAESAEQQPTVALEEEDNMQGSFNAKLAESQREKELQTFASLAQIEEKFNQIMRQNDEEIESQQKEQQEQQLLPRPTNDGDDQSDNKSLSEQQYHEAIEKAAREELERAARDSDEVEQMLYLRRSSSFSSLHSPGSPSSLSSLERPGEELEAKGEQETPEEPHMGPDTGESNCEEAEGAEESKLAEQQPPEPIKSPPSIIQEEENDDDDDDDCKEEEQVTLSGSINKETSQSDEFCGRQVSEFNLKQLKQSAQEDVMVCDANRSSTEAARRLFDSLTRPSKRPGEPVVDGTGEEQPQRPKNGSLSSADSARGDEEDSDDYARDKLDIFGGRQHDDCGSIKLVQRSGSSASSTSNNFGRTLVCSVSPTSQLAGSQTDLAASVGAVQEAHYAVEGEEMRQCRQAFRENRRLIEQAQNECRLAAAAASNQTHLAKFGTWTPGRQSSASRQTHRGQPHQLNCSNCHKRLYLVDKMELDFTRTKLNIHRHCFRCQVCSSLLRLETYAAIDSKLYCPSHVKAALPSTR